MWFAAGSANLSVYNTVHNIPAVAQRWPPVHPVLARVQQHAGRGELNPPGFLQPPRFLVGPHIFLLKQRMVHFQYMGLTISQSSEYCFPDRDLSDLWHSSAWTRPWPPARNTEVSAQIPEKIHRILKYALLGIHFNKDRHSSNSDYPNGRLSLLNDFSILRATSVVQWTREIKLLFTCCLSAISSL